MKEYIALVYSDDGVVYRCDKPYKTRRDAVMYLVGRKHKGLVCTFVLFDGLVYDWVFLKQEIVNWLVFTCGREIDDALIYTEAAINNVQAMLIMQ